MCRHHNIPDLPPPLSPSGSSLIPSPYPWHQKKLVEAQAIEITKNACSAASVSSVAAEIAPNCDTSEPIPICMNPIARKRSGGFGADADGAVRRVAITKAATIHDLVRVPTADAPVSRGEARDIEQASAELQRKPQPNQVFQVMRGASRTQKDCRPEANPLSQNHSPNRAAAPICVTTM